MHESWAMKFAEPRLYADLINLSYSWSRLANQIEHYVEFFEAIAESEERMLTLDQNTIANMTAALDFVCKKIPADKDSKELRKRIADELLRCARSGRHTLVELQKAGMTIVNETSKPARSGWFRW